MKLDNSGTVLKMLYESLGQAGMFLTCDNVTDIILYSDGFLWVDDLTKGLYKTDVCIPDFQALTTIRLIAAYRNQVVTESNPIVSSVLPVTGYRFEGIIPPVVKRPIFAIRKKALLRFKLDDYAKNCTATKEQIEIIRTATKERKNVLVVGGTGSGKTTLVGAILNEIGVMGHRIIVLEDTPELQCDTSDNVEYISTSPFVDMAMLVKSCMRLRPDRIIVGETRGREALDMIKAWNTGHPGGLSTIHASSAQQGLNRVWMCAKESGADIPPTLIADAIDLLVFIKREGTRRYIPEVSEVCAYSETEGFVAKKIAEYH